VTTTRPFSGKFLPRPLGFPKTKLYTKFEVPSLSSLWRSVRYVQTFWATWPEPRTLWGKLFMHPVGIPYAKLQTKFEVSSSDRFEYIFDCLPKILWVTWPKPRPRPVSEKIIPAPARLSQDEAKYQFKVHSSSSFQDIFDRMPKILGSRDLGHAPCLGKSIWEPARLSPDEAVYQIWSL